MLSMRPSHRSHRRVPTLPPKASIRGVGLIEVLVSLLVFSLGVLMWVNRTTGLTPEQLEKWNDRVSDTSTAGLPGGEGEVSKPDADGVVTITIEWRPPTLLSEKEPPQKYQTQVVIP
jgi:hypothetical protein